MPSPIEVSFNLDIGQGEALNEMVATIKQALKGLEGVAGVRMRTPKQAPIGGLSGVEDILGKGFKRLIPGGQLMGAFKSLGLLGGIATGIVGIAGFVKGVFDQSIILSTYSRAFMKVFGLMADMIMMPFLPLMSRVLVWVVQNILPKASEIGQWLSKGGTVGTLTKTIGGVAGITALVKFGPQALKMAGESIASSFGLSLGSKAVGSSIGTEAGTAMLASKGAGGLGLGATIGAAISAGILGAGVGAGVGGAIGLAFGDKVDTKAATIGGSIGGAVATAFLTSIGVGLGPAILAAFPVAALGAGIGAILYNDAKNRKAQGVEFANIEKAAPGISKNMIKGLGSFTESVQKSSDVPWGPDYAATMGWNTPQPLTGKDWSIINQLVENAKRTGDFTIPSGIKGSKRRALEKIFPTLESSQMIRKGMTPIGGSNLPSFFEPGKEFTSEQTNKWLQGGRTGGGGGTTYNDNRSIYNTVDLSAPYSDKTMKDILEKMGVADVDVNSNQITNWGSYLKQGGGP